MPFLCSLSIILLLGLLPISHPMILDVHSTLLSIGEELKIPSWTTNNNTSDYCTWPGISCSNDSSLLKIDLSNQRLQGNNNSLTLFSELKSLNYLDLSFNNFHGLIPPAFGNLSHLEFLDLSFNSFQGFIPHELGMISSLKALNLSNNMLVGEIADGLKGLHNLEELQLFTNRLNGSIPLWVGNLSSLRVLTAYENELIGTFPSILGSFANLEILNLHSNQLQGPIPDSIFHMEKLQILVLTQNRFTGNIPISIGNCKGLSSVRIGNNNLIGWIPREIGNISSLTYFEANNNNLSGEIVPEFSRCVNLSLLNLALNGFNGTVPLEFGLLVNLQELILSDNDLSGEIPTSILKGKNLNKLDLSSNRFNGTIPDSICNASRLQYLLLDDNEFRGGIPPEIGNCTKLLELQLGSNHLTGTVPAEIGHIKNLQIALNLSFNRLQGQLPDEFGRLDKLVTLDVSNNQLSGTIPDALKGMLSLIEVNFSNNHLTGPIPDFIPFQKSLNSSFIGNKDLCGEPLSIPCRGLDDSSLGYYHHRVSYRTVLAVIGSGLAVFISVTVVVLLFMMRERQEKKAAAAAAAAKNHSNAAASGEDEGTRNDPVILAGDVFDENLRQAIDFEAVAKATMKESNKVSIGTFSTVYRADMPSGMSVSVRRLKSMDRTVLNHRSKMIREVEKLSKINHDNLMRPMGFVLFEDEVLLLHQYYANGTLAHYLHDDESTRRKADWPARVGIAMGVAEGLAFLHNVAIIHLDISSGNIVLDSNLSPVVGEVEISKLLDPSRGTASISAVAGSFGYIPPEYAYTMQVTAPGNVYSYGVVLLEILTSRLPVDEDFGEGIDLVKWVHQAPMRGDTPEQILDARMSTVSFAWRKEMLGALKVALLCTDTTPAKRPRMKKVVEMLQELKQG